ncbi:MAG: aspartate aminotransferase family protein, partial [Acidimicrobiales bacterium]
VQVPVVGPLVGIFFSDRPVTDFASARDAVSDGRYRSFFSAMLGRGVALAPGPYEVMFPGLAHSDADLDTVVEAAADAAASVAAGRP